MAFILKPAVREKINLLFAIAGASGSGKTYSALLLAQGIAGDNGKIAVIDTEAGRSLQYAPKNGEKANHKKGTFDFLHLDLKPPFTPERYTEAIKACKNIGATVIVIDSASLVYSGEGGVAEMAENNALKRATNKKTGEINFEKLEAVKTISWAEPKTKHKRMMAKLTQIRSHIIFCLRAEEKIKMVRQDGAMKIVSQGFQPICEKNFMYEITVALTLEPTNPGKVNYELYKKLDDDTQSIFKNNQLINIEHGQKIKEWAENGCDVEPEKQIDKALNWVNNQKNIFQSCDELAAFNAIIEHQNYISAVERLRDSRPELAQDLQRCEDETRKRLEQTVAPFDPSEVQANV